MVRATADVAAFTPDFVRRPRFPSPGIVCLWQFARHVWPPKINDLGDRLTDELPGEAAPASGQSPSGSPSRSISDLRGWFPLIVVP